VTLLKGADPDNVGLLSARLLVLLAYHKPERREDMLLALATTVADVIRRYGKIEDYRPEKPGAKDRRDEMVQTVTTDFAAMVVKFLNEVPQWPGPGLPQGPAPTAH
jgi:septum formation topological specificity factor MinE